MGGIESVFFRSESDVWKGIFTVENTFFKSVKKEGSKKTNEEISFRHYTFIAWPLQTHGPWIDP